jgi:hypothetical protein
MGASLHHGVFALDARRFRNVRGRYESAHLAQRQLTHDVDLHIDDLAFLPR